MQRLAMSRPSCTWDTGPMTRGLSVALPREGQEQGLEDLGSAGPGSEGGRRWSRVQGAPDPQPGPQDTSLDHPTPRSGVRGHSTAEHLGHSTPQGGGGGGGGEKVPGEVAMCRRAGQGPQCPAGGSPWLKGAATLRPHPAEQQPWLYLSPERPWPHWCHTIFVTGPGIS